MKKTRKSVCNVPDTKDAGGNWLRSYLLTTEDAYICHHTKMGMLWNSINNRCNPAGREQKLFPNYKSCTNNFEGFQEFGDWCESQKGFRVKGDSSAYYYWQLDKDILFLGNKSYAPETCCFIPDYINSLILIGNTSPEAYSLPLGVGFHEKSGKFRARCGGIRNAKHLGLFDNPESAHKAWQTEKVLQMTAAIHKYSTSSGSRKDVIAALTLRCGAIQDNLITGGETLVV